MQCSARVERRPHALQPLADCAGTGPGVSAPFHSPRWLGVATATAVGKADGRRAIGCHRLLSAAADSETRGSAGGSGEGSARFNFRQDRGRDRGSKTFEA